ncbi:MAG TPA: hypothetical protein VMY37_13515 [Thermoguttaceae bacterium]|nr:hypothetical protein [Thermoguttaceae bacterium]
MAFQFLCPQGHLLQADESQVGRQMQCPYCGGMFLVPQPLPTAAPDPPPPAPPASPEAGPQAPPAQSPAQPPFFQPRDIEAATFQPAAAGAEPEPQVPTAADLPIVHVVCPNGHSLETPQDMLGQEALCPFCRVQFRLRLEDSVEYREEKAREQKRREIRAGQLWLRWAIAAAVVVVFGLIVLMFL